MSQQFDLSGKRALVTGGSVGIGRAVALALAAAGADVGITYLTHDGAPVLQSLRELQRRACAVQLDATDSGAVRRVVEEIAGTLGGLDILVNNAGGLIRRSPIAEMEDDLWNGVLGLNLSSAFYASRAAIPLMAGGWGRIVNIASIAGRHGSAAGNVAYGTAKAGMLGFTRGLAKEVAAQGITVNAVTPGLILDTPFHDVFNTPAGIEKAIEGIPVRRGGTPDEVAAAVLYLASPEAAFITGAVLDINGGSWVG